MNEEVLASIAGVFLFLIILGFIFAGLCEFGIIKPYWWR